MSYIVSAVYRVAEEKNIFNSICKPVPWELRTGFCKSYVSNIVFWSELALFFNRFRVITIFCLLRYVYYKQNCSRHGHELRCNLNKLLQVTVTEKWIFIVFSLVYYNLIVTTIGIWFHSSLSSLKCFITIVCSCCGMKLLCTDGTPLLKLYLKIYCTVLLGYQYHCWR